MESIRGAAFGTVFLAAFFVFGGCSNETEGVGDGDAAATSQAVVLQRDPAANPAYPADYGPSPYQPPGVVDPYGEPYGTRPSFGTGGYNGSDYYGGIPGYANGASLGIGVGSATGATCDSFGCVYW